MIDHRNLVLRLESQAYGFELGIQRNFFNQFELTIERLYIY